MKLKDALVLVTTFALYCYTILANAGIPLWSFNPDVANPPKASVSSTGTVVVNYLVSNNSFKSHKLILKPQLGVTQNGSCVLGPKNTANANCLLSLTINGAAIPPQGINSGPSLCQADVNGSPNPSQCYQPSLNSRLQITLADSNPDNAFLAANKQELALSVTGLTLDGQPSGLSRSITITNTGNSAAVALVVNASAGINTDNSSPSACLNGGTLLAGASCTVTVVPGATSTTGVGNQPCSTGIAPIPGEITVKAANSNQTLTNIVVLNYGCIYQGGFIFALFETADNTLSIGGSVVAQEDQAPRLPFGIVWSSNGLSATTGSLDYIPGINNISTPDTPLPTYTSTQTRYNNFFSNEADFPLPPASAFRFCDGANDGACNTANILTFYNNVNTNWGVGPAPYTLTAGPTNLSFYAAGLCAQSISGYTDWYLPAICQMSAGLVCNSGVQSISANFPALIGDPNANPDTSCALGANCLSGEYGSSTETQGNNGITFIWGQVFSNNGEAISNYFKDDLLGVRCTRNFTP